MKEVSLIIKWILLTAILSFYCFVSSVDIIPPPRLPNSLIKEGWCISNNDTINKLYPGGLYIMHPKYGEYLLPKSEIKLADDNTLKIPQMWKYSVSVKHLSVADTSKWHPEAIYFIFLDRTLTFRLPREKDQDTSGVANLLFQCRETEKIHLLDTIIRGDHRYFNFKLLSGEFDAILLYNSGNYIRYNKVVFEKNAHKEVNMQKLNVQPSDSASRYWLTLRAFNTPMGERIYHKYYSTISEKKIRGYLYSNGGHHFGYGPFITTNASTKWAKPYHDGYFEFDVNSGEVLEISYTNYMMRRIKITENCGLIVWMERVPVDPKVLNGRIGQF